MSSVSSHAITHVAPTDGVSRHMSSGRPVPVRHGKIQVAPRAIATVAGRAVEACYGVVGIAARHPRFGAVELLQPEHFQRGVLVRFADDHIIIDLYVVLEHGLRITEIARNIMENVKFAVERTLGLRSVRINVNVQALRVTT